MKSSTRRRALESTARVALGCYLGAMAGGCGGRVTIDDLADAGPVGDDDDRADADENPPVQQPPAPPAATTACLAPVEVVDRKLVGGLTAEQKACCQAYVQNLTEADPENPPGASTPVDASLLNCCRALANGAQWDQTVAHRTCCFHDFLPREDFNQPYCSPWGPPMPPALPRAHALGFA